MEHSCVLAAALLHPWLWGAEPVGGRACVGLVEMCRVCMRTEQRKPRAHLMRALKQSSGYLLDLIRSSITSKLFWPHPGS